MNRKARLGISFSVLVCLLGLMISPGFGQGPYKGVTLNVLCSSGFLAKVWRTQAQEWAKENGAKVVVHETAFANLYDKIMTEFFAGGATYDVIQYPCFWNGDFMGGGFMLPLDKYIKAKDPGLEDYIPIFRDRWMKYGDTYYGLTIDGDYYVTAYRKDLFEDPKEKADFRARYGYELKMPADNWDQWLDYAEFFTRDTNGDGEPDFWGTTEICKRGLISLWQFTNRFSSYLGTPYLYDGGIWFDPDTMEPLINTPAAVKGLENYLASTDPKCSPPGVKGHSWSELWNLFITGKVAMVCAFPDLGPLSIDPKKSTIIGKAAFCMQPGSNRVWSVAEKKWKDIDKIQRVSSLQYGRTIGIPATSKNPDAAYDLMVYMVTGPRAVEQALWSDDGLDPYKFSQLENAKVKEMWSLIPTFIPATLDNLTVGVPDLRIPGTMEYYDAIEIYMAKALQGELTAKQALDQLGEQWKKILKERGLKEQQNAYRLSLGLSPAG